VLLEVHIDFCLQLTQTGLPSARGQGRYILCKFLWGQWNRIFSYLNDFPGLILGLWYMFLVNHLPLKETQKEREKKMKHPFLHPVSTGLSTFCPHIFFSPGYSSEMLEPALLLFIFGDLF
jgi:hypothetical protein